MTDKRNKKDKLDKKKIVSSDAPQITSSSWTNTGSFKNKPSTGWGHETSNLEGKFGISYAVTFCGRISITQSLSGHNEAIRIQAIREAILRVLEQSKVRKFDKKSRKGQSKKIKEIVADRCDTSLTKSSVNLILNADKFQTMYSNATTLFKHPTSAVSFVATGIGETSDYIGYVARDNLAGRFCFVYDCVGNSQLIADTMRQAFEVKLKELLRKPETNPLNLNNPFTSGYWGEEHIYSGDHAELGEKPNITEIFDDNIYEGMAFSQNEIDYDGIYDNKTEKAERIDQDFYDNFATNNPDNYMEHTKSDNENNIYDNKEFKVDRMDESNYDNLLNYGDTIPDDYMEGKLKDNMYDNNVRGKYDRACSSDNNIYDNSNAKNKIEKNFSQFKATPNIYDVAGGGSYNGSESAAPLILNNDDDLVDLNSSNPFIVPECGTHNELIYDNKVIDYNELPPQVDFEERTYDNFSGLKNEATQDVSSYNDIDPYTIETENELPYYDVSPNLNGGDISRPTEVIYSETADNIYDNKNVTEQIRNSDYEIYDNETYPIGNKCNESDKIEYVYSYLPNNDLTTTNTENDTGCNITKLSSHSYCTMNGRHDMAGEVIYGDIDSVLVEEIGLQDGQHIDEDINPFEKQTETANIDEDNDNSYYTFDEKLYDIPIPENPYAIPPNNTLVSTEIANFSIYDNYLPNETTPIEVSIERAEIPTELEAIYDNKDVEELNPSTSAAQ